MRRDGCQRSAAAAARSRALAAAALWLAAASGAAVGGAGCRGAGAPAMPAFPPGAQVLHLAVQDDVPTLDPAAGYDTASWTFEQMIFDTLVRYSDGGVDLVPEIATSWDESPDARVFTFHLRRDARFTNGRAVTAADFKYEIERVLDPATRSKGMEYFREITGAAEFQAGHAHEVAGIATPDPWTIVFHLDGARSDLRAEARDAVCGGGAARSGRTMGRGLLQPRGRQRPVQARPVDRRPASGAGQKSRLLHQGRSAPGRGGRGNRRQRRSAVAQVRGRRDRRFENSVGRVSVRDEDAARCGR